MNQDELSAQHLEPLWLKMSAMVPPTPKPVAKPHMWSYKDTLPHLLKAGETVPAEEAERRVLMLVNPNMESPFTTDTIYGGLQLVKPGEIAPAHRHIAFAVRFIIEGEGFTAVEGKKLPLERGDVVVTPTWHWHDHGNESDSNIIWLDALNLPLFRFARVHFAEGYSDSRYPSTLCNDSEWRIPWSRVEATLSSDTAPHAIYHYKNGSGGPLSTTLAVQAERIDAGHTTEESQEQCSFMYHCYTGDGQTIVTPANGEKVVFKWTSRDTFAVPAWSKIQHVNESGTPAYLVAVSDRSLLDLLQLQRPSA
ncbi:related to gentisate 1,2-dioxygenase oxidoreductase [Cephalotrichum gorgonifer]|uniref:Related to gentisate 1,2-dioxygenase oxidoreductase n=1 Tax=Cephalotrichum gorgonifer TaxID=2041049 RepID=A0AAE8SZ17_9PEZI|nr:related to gentisate 1,2-dioxygenase oxidoreductase [Cephalotrichum gorgonifer]